MSASPHSSLHQEISRLALFISLPQVIASPILVGLKHIVQGDNVVFDVMEIIDFLVISFPLTLGIAILLVVLEKGEFNLVTLLVAIVGAAFLSNLLHTVIGKIPSVDIKNTFTESFNYNNYRGGNTTAIIWVIKIFSIYWKSFGPILFIQSCCIGIYAGIKYIKIENSMNTKK